MISIESYRQAIRNNKLLVYNLVGSYVVVVALTITIVVMLPLKTTEYKLYEFSSSGQTFYRIDSSQELVSRTQALVGMITRNYVVTREAKDRLTEVDRFVVVEELSAGDVFDDFKLSYEKVDKALGNDSKRKITIELDNPFNNNWNSKVHIVDFQTTDTVGGKETIRYWKAVIGYDLKEQKIRLDDLVQNPIGLEVTSYSVTRRNILGDK